MIYLNKILTRRNQTSIVGNPKLAHPRLYSPASHSKEYHCEWKGIPLRVEAWDTRFLAPAATAISIHRFRQGVYNSPGRWIVEEDTMARKDYYHESDAPEPNSLVPAVSAVVTDSEGRILLHNGAIIFFGPCPGERWNWASPSNKR